MWKWSPVESSSLTVSPRPQPDSKGAAATADCVLSNHPSSTWLVSMWRPAFKIFNNNKIRWAPWKLILFLNQPQVLLITEKTALSNIRTYSQKNKISHVLFFPIHGSGWNPHHNLSKYGIKHKMQEIVNCKLYILPSWRDRHISFFKCFVNDSPKTFVGHYVIAYPEISLRKTYFKFKEMYSGSSTRKI